MAKIFVYLVFVTSFSLLKVARQACKNIGHEERNHFVEITEMVNLGSGA
jgi:hypothetical protein